MNKQTTRLLEQHFDTAFDAPDGIKKLRELILTLAMQGKLVPQDPNDQPASELLKEIEAEKKRLIKEGKIKKTESLTPIKPEERPFKLPIGWSWIRLNDLTSLITKGSSPNWQGVNYTDSENGILFVTSENVDSFKLRLERKKYVEKKFNQIEPRSILQKNDILMNLVGASIGRVAYYNLDEIANINQAVCIIRLINLGTNLNLRFMLAFFNSKICISYMFDKQVENARANLSMTNVSKFVIPMPPQNEQKRIVEKIDQLMARVDELEKLRNERSEKRLKIHAAAIDQLLSAKSDADFAAAWRFITGNFDSLYSVKENVAELRKAILQLAVMGRLVPQDPNDQPASELLKEIEAEKKRLIKEGKIKPSKPLPPIKSEEVPFKLPIGWSWVRLNDLTSLITKGSSPNWQGINYTDSENGILFVTSENVDSFKLRLERKKYVEKKFNQIEPRSILQKNDILMNLVGASIGRVAYYNLDEIANINQAVCIIRLINLETDLNLRFMLAFFNSKICISYMFDKQVENARANLSMTNVSKFVIPIPPQNEQQRIVEKVDQLMALCDKLEQNLAAASEKQAGLLNSLMAKV